MIAGAVLAAGASRRMGSPKALARIGHSTFLDSMTASLFKGGCKPVIAVLAHHYEQIEQNCFLDNVDVVINPDPYLGQISSLVCAMDAVKRADGFLFVLVDQAYVSPETIREVADALRQAPCAVARFNGQPGHPTAFSRDVFDSLREPEILEGGAKVLVNKLEACGDVAWVDVDDPGVTRNINTPEDLAAIESSEFYNEK